MLRTRTVHPYIMDTTPDEKGRFFESPFAVHGTMHTEKQDNEYYERYIEGKNYFCSDPQNNTQRKGKELNANVI